MAQLTIKNINNSIVDVLIIPSCLHDELRRIMRFFELEELNLPFLRQTKQRVLSKASKTLKEHGFKGNDSQKIQDLAVENLDWFSYLLDAICLIEQLKNPESLILTISN